MVLGKARNQRGAGAIGCLFVILLLGGGAYAGYELGMPRIRHTSFKDRMNETVYHLQRLPADVVRKRVIEIAEEFDIALKPEQVKVESTGNKLVIDVQYEKFVDLKIWQTKLPFSLHLAGTF